MMEKCSHTAKFSPRVAELVQKYISEVYFVCVRCSVEDTSDGLRKFTRKNKLQIPVLDDADGSLSRYFKVRVAPSFAVIDREGVLRYFGGFDNDTGHKLPVAAEPMLDPVIRSVLRGEEVRIKRGVPNGCVVRLPGSQSG